MSTNSTSESRELVETPAFRARSAGHRVEDRQLDPV